MDSFGQHGSGSVAASRGCRDPDHGLTFRHFHHPACLHLRHRVPGINPNPADPPPGPPGTAYCSTEPRVCA